MKLNKITLGLLVASCALATVFSANATAQSTWEPEKRLSMDDDLNIIRGLSYKHMISTDDGKTWQRYIDQETWATHTAPEQEFLGQVTVQVAELNQKVIDSVAYDADTTYDKPGTMVMHNGYFWTNGWWANPGEKPGENAVWKRGEAVKMTVLATFEFTPFKGQKAVDYQKKLKAAIASQRKVIGYFPEWGVYEAHNNFTPDKVAYDQLSHLNYGFAVLTKDGIVAMHDTWSGAKNMQDIAKRTKKAGVANIISIGGYTNSQECALNCNGSGEGVKMFQAATATPEKVERLANSIVEYMLKWQFDGVDIDWEYPTSEKEADQYTQLIKSLRNKLDTLGKQNDRYYQLSSAVTANHKNIKFTNPAETVPLLDSVNVMTYDYHGAFDPITGHNSPLYGHYNDTDAKFNIDSTMREYHLGWNIPKSKLLVGLSWYGRAWGNVEGTEKVPGSPGLFNPGSGTIHGQWDDKNEYTGTNPYRLLKEMALDKQYQRYWDAQSHAPYLYNASTKAFYTYDDVQSIREKVDYIKNEGYGGAIIWDLSGDTDDHELGAISAELLENKNQPLGMKFDINRQADNRIAIKTTLDKDIFSSENDIKIYINDVYEGGIYNGKSYLSYNTFNTDNTVTVKTNFTEMPKAGDVVKVVLANAAPGSTHGIEDGAILYQATITEEMLKPLAMEAKPLPGTNISYVIGRQSDNRIAIKTTLDKQAFNSKNRIEIFINDFYEGDIHNGNSYLSYNTFNKDGSVTVKTNFTKMPKVGDEVKVVLTNVDSTLYPNIEANTLLYRATITADMLK